MVGTRKGAIAALGVIGVFALSASTALGATGASFADPGGDAVDPDGGSTDDATADLRNLDIELSGPIEMTFELAQATSLGFFASAVLFESPYGGGGTGMEVVHDTADGTTEVFVFDSDGNEGTCPSATVSGVGTTTVTVMVPASCINPPAEAVVQVFTFGDSFGIDLLDVRHALDTFGTGPNTLTNLIDGDPATSERLDAWNAFIGSISISQALFAEGATGAILVRGDVFADALAGSALFGDVDGPMLFTGQDALPDATRTELQRILDTNGDVVVLGGPDAIHQSVLDELTAMGFQPRRVSGANRIQTSIAVADSLDVAGELFIARGWGPSSDPNGTAAWADSIAAAPYVAGHGAAPVVLVGQALLDDHRALLDRVQPSRITILGGTAAVPAAIQSELESLGYEVRRIAGENRADTAAQFADEVWSEVGLNAPGRVPTGPRGVALLNAYSPDGWAFGLAAAPAAAIEGLPYLLVTDTNVPAPTALGLTSCEGRPAVETWVIGGTGRIPQSVVDQAEALDPTAACG